MAQPLEILDQLAELEDRYHSWDLELLQSSAKYNEIKAKIDEKLVKEIQSCSETATAVNIVHITNKLQPYFNTHHQIDLQHTFWQSHIAKTMARTLTTLNFQQVQSPTNDEHEPSLLSTLMYPNAIPPPPPPPPIQSKTTVPIRFRNSAHSLLLSDDIKETLELEEIMNEPGLELQNAMNDHDTTTLWNEIQRDIEEQERRIQYIQSDEDSHSLSKSNEVRPIQYDSIPLRWKSRGDFKVERGITTTQITKIGGSYSSIVSLEPMVSRKYKYTFLLSDIRETGKPWLGIGIISSKCPLLTANQSIEWHASNEYSIGWYYGTDIWHAHVPLRSNYGNGSYWKSGDEIQLIVDCKNYTLQYKLNGVDLGIAASNFDKLLNSDKRCHFYVIISVQHNMNSLTLMDAHRYREDRNRSNSVNATAAKDAVSFVNAFKSVDVTSVSKQEQKKMECEAQEVELLRSKLGLQTKISAVFKQKWEKLIVSYRELERVHKEERTELNKLKQATVADQKELDLSRGVMHELKKLSIHKLHDLEAHLLGSIQNVQKAIANQYENKYDCRVCMTNEKDTVLIPCGHFLCSQCVAKVNECPMCRANIEKTVKLN